MGVLGTVVQDKDEFWFILHLLLVQVGLVGARVTGFGVFGGWLGFGGFKELGEIRVFVFIVMFGGKWRRG